MSLYSRPFCSDLQLTTMQKEMQKQMTVIIVPVTKEGRRVEAALGRSMEKAVKAHSEALCACCQEENVKQEELVGESAHSK